MRPFLLAAVLALSAAPAASAFTAPDAQAAFVERRGLIEIDTRCRVLAAGPRSALEAGALQARGALLRAGWTRARLDELEQATIAAARRRACADPRNSEAAARARAGFNSWARTNAMNFAGAERSWAARRYPDAFGWRLTQQVAAPVAATFGVRDVASAQQLTLAIPLTGNAAMPGTAQLLLRDRARAGVEVLELRGRTARGLAAGAPAANAASAFFANARRVETPARGQRVAVLVFPDAAFQAMLALDPREAVELRLETNGVTQRILIEVGDLAVARAFLTIQPES